MERYNRRFKEASMKQEIDFPEHEISIVEDLANDNNLEFGSTGDIGGDRISFRVEGNKKDYERFIKDLNKQKIDWQEY